MTNDRWQRVKRLFEAAVDLPKAKRTAFLTAAAGGDEELRRDVEALLVADKQGAGLSDQLPRAPESLVAGFQKPSDGISSDGPGPGVDVHPEIDTLTQSDAATERDTQWTD